MQYFFAMNLNNIDVSDINIACYIYVCIDNDFNKNRIWVLNREN